MPQGQRTLTEVDGVVEIGPVGPVTQKELAPAQAHTSRKRDAAEAAAQPAAARRAARGHATAAQGRSDRQPAAAAAQRGGSSGKLRQVANINTTPNKPVPPPVINLVSPDLVPPSSPPSGAQANPIDAETDLWSGCLGEIELGNERSAARLHPSNALKMVKKHIESAEKIKQSKRLARNQTIKIPQIPLSHPTGFQNQNNQNPGKIPGNGEHLQSVRPTRAPHRNHPVQRVFFPWLVIEHIHICLLYTSPSPRD